MTRQEAQPHCFHTYYIALFFFPPVCMCWSVPHDLPPDDFRSMLCDLVSLVDDISRLQADTQQSNGKLIISTHTFNVHLPQIVQTVDEWFLMIFYIFFFFFFFFSFFLSLILDSYFSPSHFGGYGDKGT